jgi:hypothetical protein
MKTLGPKKQNEKVPKKTWASHFSLFPELKKLGETPSTDMIPHKPHPFWGRRGAGAQIFLKRRFCKAM